MIPKKAVVFLAVFTLLLSVQCSAQPLAWRYSAVGAVTSLSISADGKYVAVGNKDGVVYLLDREKGVELWRYTIWEGVNAISISGDGSYIAVGGNSRILYLFDKELSGKSYLWRYPLGAAVLDVAISKDGRYIVAGSFDHNVYFFESGRPKPLWSYLTEGSVRSVDISEDGSFLAVGSDGGYLYIFGREYTHYTFISRFKAGGPIRSVSISGDGYSVAAGSSDGYVYFQDTRKDENDYTWRHRLKSKVTSVSVSDDGGFAAAGDSSGRIYLFDKDHSGNSYLWSYPVGAKSTLVSVSGDGGLLASGSEEGVYLFDRDFKDNSFLWYLPLKSAVTDLEISLDGSSIVVGDDGGYVYMFWPSVQPSEHLSGETTTATLEETTSATSSIGEVKPARGLYFYLLIIISVTVVVGFAYLRVIRKKHTPKKPSKHEFGYEPLDSLLKEGIPSGYSIVLSSAPCDQKDDVIKGFLRTGLKEGSIAVYISNDVDKVMDLMDTPKMHVLICNPQADEIAPPLQNVEKVKSIENLTDVNIGIMKLLEKLYEESSLDEEGSKPIRICLDNLDDVLIQHKGSTTRKWLLELIPRLKRMNGIILATVNPEMHSKEDLNAVASIFDGQIDILEETKRGKLYRKILVSRMYNVEYSKRGVDI